MTINQRDNTNPLLDHIRPNTDHEKRAATAYVRGVLGDAAHDVLDALGLT